MSNVQRIEKAVTKINSRLEPFSREEKLQILAMAATATRHYGLAHQILEEIVETEHEPKGSLPSAPEGSMGTPPTPSSEG